MDTPNDTRTFDKELIRASLAEARRQIELCSDGRDVRLMAVTKTVPVEVINYAIDELGITAIGENRVQELLSKYDALHKTTADGDHLKIHLIGSLQTNKVKYIIDKVDMIESVDSLKLAAEINRQAAKIGGTMDILVEINIGREPQKGGILPEELENFIAALREYPRVILRGLMTIAPKCDTDGEYEKYFSETKELFARIPSSVLTEDEAKAFDTLSMGMSQSYKQAIKAGSTEVRLGSTLFGARTYPEIKN